ncbi:hypothetical protein [Vallitalea okinawensis]|uniref:hypothetical protein n=1 Tax=Vallitalea okinawensis TaxID=2078660 RepID=UPI0013001DBB|nr:hypothetical protein [Vallitalea okinawensis]
MLNIELLSHKFFDSRRKKGYNELVFVKNIKKEVVSMLNAKIKSTKKIDIKTNEYVNETTCDQE